MCCGLFVLSDENPLCIKRGTGEGLFPGWLGRPVSLPDEPLPPPPVPFVLLSIRARSVSPWSPSGQIIVIFCLVLKVSGNRLAADLAGSLSQQSLGLDSVSFLSLHLGHQLTLLLLTSLPSTSSAKVEPFRLY